MEILHQPEEIIGDRYRLVTPLGCGAMGTTYEAEDLTNYRRVALKAISLHHISDWKVLELFEREAKVLAHLNHPSIPKYLDYFYLDTPDDRHFYLVRELVSGESLADWVERGWHPSVEQVKQIAIQLLTSLEYLHSLRPPIIHRDIKPQNIICCQDGRVFLVDFGAVQDVYRNTLTRGGTFVGTLGYMPQEQFRGQALPASDLYSLGATLLFLLAGRSPDFFPQNRLKIDFRSRMPVEENFARWLEKMLEPVAEDRFSSAAEALNALQLVGQPLVPKALQQPIGSQIKFKKTDERLVIYIPPAIWSFLNSPEFACFPFILMFGIPISLIFGVNPNSQALLHVIVIRQIVSTIPLAIAITLCLKAALLNNVASTYLEINRATFRIKWKAPFFKREVKGRTADIKKVKLDSSQFSNHTITTPTLVMGSGKCQFGRRVAQEEKQWLIDEISNFLGFKKVR